MVVCYCLRLWICLLLVIAFCPLKLEAAGTKDQEVTFEITKYKIQGSTLFNRVTLKDAVDGFTGEHMTARDVEKARDKLERFYHERGYPTVLVNIPEQKVEDGVVELEVIEARIRKVEVTGNSYFTAQMIKGHMPSLEPGKVLYVPDLQKDLASVNAISSDLKVVPKIEPGPDLSTVDIELIIQDELPVHGSLSLSNRGTHQTTDLRLNADVSYDNLWQKGHSISFQYQTAPEKPEEVQVFGSSYVLPAPWEDRHIMAFYGLVTDSQTAFGRGFQTVGEGFILGMRYILPLPEYKKYTHNLTLGLDYKDFEESTRLDGLEFLESPVTYVPLSISYGSRVPDEQGLTRFDLALNVAFRNMVTEQEEFERKRSGARGSYAYLTGGLERRQKLPWDLELLVGIDGQIASQPLISNEQYIAGGMENVRGYKESEESGDNAVHWTVELFWQGASFGGKNLAFHPFAFFDGAWLELQEALPGQEEYMKLLGTGIGIDGWWAFDLPFFSGKIKYNASLGWALEETDYTEEGHLEGHFNVSYYF